MNIRFGHITLTFIATCALAIIGCSDDEEMLPPFAVNFSAAELGISSDNPQAELVLTFSRPATSAGNVTLAIEPGDLNYGETADFYTSIPPIDNVIILPFASGDQRLSLSVFAGLAKALEQDQTLLITLRDDSDGIFTPGSMAQVNIIFTENFLSQGGSLNANVGPKFSQRAYFDLSKAFETVVPVDNYDLGFHTGEGFYVTLNASAKLMARPLDKNDLNAVTAADTAGFADEMVIPAPNFDPSIGSVAWIDTPDGNLETTAFGEISANDADNSVYIIKRDKGDWKKVRVLRDSDGYVLQYADIDASTFETLVIVKDPSFETITIDFDQGIVTASPENDRWDFVYGKYTEILNVGGPGADIPYEFNDYITINRADVSVAMVMTGDISYETFGTSNLDGLSFDNKINVIGSSWRQGGGPGAQPSLFTDRFYILRDEEGNTFKILFTGMYSDNDERGELSLTYELLN